jgi:hypothetical protein
MPLFCTSEDLVNQRVVALHLATLWNCRLRSMEETAPIDFVADRDGIPVGLVEVKCRKNASTKYPTVFLSYLKYKQMRTESILRKLPAIYLISYTDGIRYVKIDDVDTSRTVIAGRQSRPGAAHDQEEIIEVDLWDMWGTDTIPF